MARVYVRSLWWTVCKFLILVSLALFVAGMVGWFVVYFLGHFPVPVAMLALLGAALVTIRRRR